MTDAPAPVIHAHWHANNQFSLSACGAKWARWNRDAPPTLTHDMAKVTCPECKKVVAAAGLAV